MNILFKENYLGPQGVQDWLWAVPGSTWGYLGSSWGLLGVFPEESRFFLKVFFWALSFCPYETSVIQHNARPKKVRYIFVIALLAAQFVNKICTNVNFTSVLGVDLLLSIIWRVN